MSKTQQRTQIRINKPTQTKFISPIATLSLLLLIGLISIITIMFSTYSVNAKRLNLDAHIQELIQKANQSNISLSSDAHLVMSKLNQYEQDKSSFSHYTVSTQKYDDVLYSIKQLFIAKLNIELNKDVAEYQDIFSKFNELENIKKNIYLCIDELNALKHAIDNATDINQSLLYDMLYNARLEFENERYEQCLNEVDQTYAKISELRSTRAKLEAFYDAASRNILTFLDKNKYNLMIIVLGLFVLYLILHKPIIRYRINKQIQNLEIRKETIKQLIAQTQRAYFEEGKISETQYNIRTRKFGELIRDINRQLPLLREALIEAKLPKKAPKPTEHKHKKAKKAGSFHDTKRKHKRTHGNDNHLHP